MFNRFKKTLILAGVLSLCVALSAPADSNAGVQRTLQAIYNAQDAAAGRKDMAAFLKPYARDIKIDRGGGATANYNQITAAMAPIFAKATSISGITKVLTCSAKGNSATVTVTSTAVFKARNPKTNKLVTLSDTGKSRDDWEKSATGWHLKRSKLLSSLQTVDGKRVH